MNKLASVLLATAALALPAAAAFGRGDGHRVETPRTVEYVFHGVVSADASNGAVDVKGVHGISKHARRALAGASMVTIKLDRTTRLTGKRGLKGTRVTLTVGDRVQIVIRARAGLFIAALPAAGVVHDRGPKPGSQAMPVPSPM